MALFPAFLNLKQQKILIVGAGRIALHKIKKILPFEPDIIVIAPSIRAEIMDLANSHQLKVEQRVFQSSDLQDCFMVIIAVDSLPLQKEVFELCRAKKILCNAVDSVDYCSFIFPSLVVNDPLSIGICTGGNAPAVSAALRKYLEKTLPPDLDKIISKISEYRDSLPKGEERQKKVIALTHELLDILE